MDIIDDLLLDDLIVPGSDQDPYIVDWHGRYRGVDGTVDPLGLSDPSRHGARQSPVCATIRPDLTASASAA